MRSTQLSSREAGTSVLQEGPFFLDGTCPFTHCHGHAQPRGVVHVTGEGAVHNLPDRTWQSGCSCCLTSSHLHATPLRSFS